MKKILFTIALLLAAYFSFGQTIQKGNMLGVHILTVELKPNVTSQLDIIFRLVLRNWQVQEGVDKAGFHAIGGYIEGIDEQPELGSIRPNK